MRIRENIIVLRTLLAILVMATWQSCEWEKLEPLDEADLPETVSFAEHIQPIFTSNCTKCHNGTTPPNLLPDESYIELTGGGYINTDDPEQSKLFRSINLGGSMYQYASDLDRALILKWIAQGAEEN